MKTANTNTVELKVQRSKVKADRKALAENVKQRDLTPEEQDQFDALGAQLDALTKRIEVLEAVQDSDDDDVAEDAADESSDDTVENSRARSLPKHLEFNISTKKTRKDSGVYSIQRALQQACEYGGTPRDGIEGEHHREVSRYRNGNGFWMPLNAPLAKGRTVSRDLTTTTGAGAVKYETASTFIELLRSKLIVDQLGIKVLTGLQGITYIPRQNGASQTYMMGEGVSVTPSNPTFDSVQLVPKTIGADVAISRKSIVEFSFDAQSAVENDMSEVLARGIQRRIFNGSPVNEAAAITGVLQRSDVKNYVLADDAGNGGHLTYADAVAIEGYVADQNIEMNDLKWTMTNGLKARLKNTPQVIPGAGGTAYPSFVFIDNTVNTYPVLTTSDMPSGLTKGTSTTCHSAIFGNWSDAMLGLWTDVNIVVDPYTYKKSGAIEITMLQDIDFQLSHPSAWVVVTDALVS